MIVKMSKVEIVGAKSLLEDVLSILHKEGVFHIEPTTVGFIERKEEEFIGTFLPDKETLSQRLFLEDMKARVDELFSCLSRLPIKDSYIQPEGIIDTINETLKRHLIYCKELRKRKESLQRELSELNQYVRFLEAIEPLLDKITQTPDIEYIGLTIEGKELRDKIRMVLMHKIGDRFELLTTTAPDGKIVGLIAIDRSVSEDIKRLLSEHDIPEMRFPPHIEGLGFAEKMVFIKQRVADVLNEIELIDMQMDSFSMKWGAIYRKVRGWLEERLSLMNATASVFETSMCFVIYGWMQRGDVERLTSRLDKEFKGEVVLSELELHEDDIDRVPIILRNPAYFKPFELLTRLLPLPRYTSYDPTPFIGIFFPIFFGMILGDIGYGSILFSISLMIIWRFKERRDIQDAGKILSVCAMYSMLFGVLYGEFLGDLGHRVFGLKPVLIERREAIMPMLYFAVTVGVVHLGIGSLLGFVSALRKRIKREVLAHLFQMLTMLSILILVASLFGIFPRLLTRPLILIILILTPLLLFTGGLLAPLELIKGIGNIISYARIMAIGLTSVLLASVANEIAGMTGEIIIGVVVAGLLHILNIVIGVFSPTIHSLRLHYVEFFSKFIDIGGRRFEPLRRR
ncbi:MAG: V-type ATP synthase subunit I [Thermodesulfovibrionia bacterium]